MYRYYMPTKILAGENVLVENYRELLPLGKKAMIVTGRASSKKNGSLDDVQEALNKAAIDSILFDQVEENPSLETIVRAGEIGKAEKVDFIIGVGGGSPIDAAKFIGVLINNPELSGDDVFQVPGLKSIPLVAVPTTSGTGTETTPYAIITLHEEKTKKNFNQSVFPELAFLDPRYTYDLPINITVNTAIDAFSHLVEGYLNRRASLITDATAEAGLRLWGECIDSLLAGQFDTKVREKLLIASTIGGMVIAQTGTSLPHGMGYALTYHKGLPHGLANGVLFVEYLKAFRAREKVERLPQLLGLQDFAALEQVLNRLLRDQFDRQTFPITAEEIKEYTATMIENKGKLANHPEEVGFEDLYAIYSKSLMLE